MAFGGEMGLRWLSAVFVLLGLMVRSSMALETVSMVDFCGQTIGGDGMIVNSHADSRKYYFVSIGTDCRLTMQAATLKDKVQFQFRYFLVYSLVRMSNLQSETSGAGLNSSRRWPSSAEPTRPPAPLSDPCNAGSYVQFYDGKDHHSEPLGTPLCGKTIPRPVLSTGNYLTLRLVTRGQQPRVDFVGDFTSFRIGTMGTRTPAHASATTPSNLSCDTDGNNKGLGPNNVQPHGSDSDRKAHSFLYLYIILGLVVGVALLFWCCWSPGWFIWRISVCRFIPCCNSFCASCHLCSRSCTWRDGGRPSKVTPQSTAVTAPV